MHSSIRSNRHGIKTDTELSFLYSMQNRRVPSFFGGKKAGVVHAVCVASTTFMENMLSISDRSESRSSCSGAVRDLVYRLYIRRKQVEV